MISEAQKKFIDSSVVNSINTNQQNILNTNNLIYQNKFSNASLQYANINLAKKRAGAIKHRVLNNLDKYLVEFEANFTKRGGKVIWALNSQQAVDEIYTIILKNNYQHIVKSKSVLSEEIELQKYLKTKGIELKETDFIEFIKKGISGDNQFVSDLNAYNKEEIKQYLVQKYGLSKDKSINEIITTISKIKKEIFINSEVGIVEADFIISDIGAVSISENDGDSVLSSSFTKVNIVLASIEKVIPNLADLELFLPLLSTFKTGEKISAYNTILTGPCQEDETDGPTEMYVILIDNNRTEVLSKKEQRKAMSCIQCGACSVSCPIVSLIGNNISASTYKGPIGSVVTPYLKGINEYSHLSYATTLCGKCSEVCPVNIPLHELFLHNRNDFVNKREISINEKLLFWTWKKIILSRNFMNLGSVALKNKVFSMVFSKIWGKKRKLPEFSPKNFNQMWREKSK